MQLLPHALPSAPVLPVRLNERFPDERLLTSDEVKEVKREKPDGPIIWRASDFSPAGAGGADESVEAQHRFTETLGFSIDFKSGSLHSVKQIGEREYSLRLRPDHYTQGYCSWFFFSMRPLRAAVPYTFHLEHCGNMSKLFKEGK